MNRANCSSAARVLACFAIASFLQVLPSSGQGSATLGRAGIEQLKKSTAFVRLDAGRESATGSGFLLKKEGRVGFVVTNSHVVTASTDRPATTSVVFNSGLPDELELEAEVVANQQLRDLAVLRIESDSLPETIPSMAATDLYETLPVYIAGFPFGEALAEGKKGPAITISRGTVSSIRRDDANRVATIQIDGSINPGNSGGPIVGADGKLIGIAVAKVTGTQIGMAIPVHELNELLQGEAGPVLVQREANAGDKIKLKFHAILYDPMALVAGMELQVGSAPSSPPKPNQDGRWERVKSEDSIQKPLVLEDRVRSASLEWPSANENKIVLQPRLKLRDGSTRWSVPTIIDMPKVGQELLTYRGRSTVVSPAPPRVVTSPTPRRRTPPRPPSRPSGSVPPVDAGELDLFNQDAEDLVGSFCWSSDGTAAYTLSKTGTLKQYALNGRELMAETQLLGVCGQLTRCQDGLVAVINSTQTVAVLDEKTLAVKRSIRVPGMASIACSSQTSIGFVGTVQDRRFLIHRIDLEAGESLGISEPDSSKSNLRLPRFNPETLVASPDGKYLFAEGGIEALVRMRVDPEGIAVEESTARIISGRRAPIIVSSDSRLVAVPSGGGNSQIGSLPRVPYATHLFKVNDFSNPAVTVQSGAYPLAFAVDLRARFIYASNYEVPFIVFNAGGARVRELKTNMRRSPEVKQILPHPSGFCAGVLTDKHLFWADITDLAE